MNWNMFQTIHESKDSMQYVKTLEALEHYAFKTYTLDLRSIFDCNLPEFPHIKIPVKCREDEANKNPTLLDIYQMKLKDNIKEEKNLDIASKSLWVVVR